MTGTELQLAFAEQSVLLGDRMPLEEDDIFYWLTQAQSQLITSAYTEFEESKILTPLLATIIERTKVNTTNGVEGLGQYTSDQANFPENTRYILSVVAHVANIANIGYRVTGGARVPKEAVTTVSRSCNLTQRADLYRMLSDPFNTTTVKRPLAVFGKEFVSVLTGPLFVVPAVTFDWIRNPVPVTRDGGCELPDFTHHDLVRLGSALFQEAKGPPPSPPRKEQAQ